MKRDNKPNAQRPAGLQKTTVSRRLSKVQILNKVIDGLMQVPLPKEGKTVGCAGNFHNEISTAFKLARYVQWADSIEEMNEAYATFKQHIDWCVANGG